MKLNCRVFRVKENNAYGNEECLENICKFVTKIGRENIQDMSGFGDYSGSNVLTVIVWYWEN